MNNVDNFNLKSNQENDEQNDEASLSAENAEGIKNIGSVLTGKEDTLIHCLTIIGQIEGHYILPSQNKTTKYEHIIPLLVSVEEDPNVKGILILLNKDGGDVEAGLAIAEVIAGMKKPTVSIVLGGGHSIGIMTVHKYVRQEPYTPLQQPTNLPLKSDMLSGSKQIACR